MKHDLKRQTKRLLRRYRITIDRISETGGHPTFYLTTKDGTPFTYTMPASPGSGTERQMLYLEAHIKRLQRAAA